MKYIILETEDGRAVPVIFPDLLVHKDVSIALCRMIARETTEYVNPVSAGFIDMVAVATHGESETLDLKSKETDRQIINTINYNGGYTDNILPSVERLIIQGHVNNLNKKLL